MITESKAHELFIRGDYSISATQIEIMFLKSRWGLNLDIHLSEDYLTHEDKFYYGCVNGTIIGKASLVGGLKFKEIQFESVLAPHQKNPQINGIWDNAYVQQLGILSHCNEVITLDNNIIKEKGLKHSEKINKLSDCIEREVMDLYIILRKWAIGKENILEERYNKFWGKVKNYDRD